MSRFASKVLSFTPGFSPVEKGTSGVQLLLDRGANINAEDSEGYTALINASFSNSPDMVRLLLSKGANVNAPSNLMVNGKKAGFTPMMIAKSRGHQEIVKLLMEAGAEK